METPALGFVVAIKQQGEVYDTIDEQGRKIRTYRGDWIVSSNGEDSAVTYNELYEALAYLKAVRKGVEMRFWL